MDVQFYGANCLVFSNKDIRIVVDDNLASLGAKTVTKPGDVVLFTGAHDEPVDDSRMTIDMPGDYELGNVSIHGIPARSHLDEAGTNNTIFKLTVGELVYAVLGHIYPELSDDQLENIGMVDVLFVPVGGNGFTLDPVGAQKLIRKIDPKLVIPTHYEDKALNYEVPQQPLAAALKEMSMEPTDTVQKLRIKPGELAETTHLSVLEKA